MGSNLLLEQYSRYKKLELEASPFHFLLDANIELNPHQINAFCAALQALKTGGIVLADEVGLGKTIEAGLVLKYVLESGAKRVLIALPASLTAIEENAFVNCESLKTVRFGGTEAQWADVTINRSNEALTAATVYFQ